MPDISDVFKLYCTNDQKSHSNGKIVSLVGFDMKGSHNLKRQTSS